VGDQGALGVSLQAVEVVQEAADIEVAGDAGLFRSALGIDLEGTKASAPECARRMEPLKHAVHMQRIERGKDIGIGRAEDHVGLEGSLLTGRKV